MPIKRNLFAPETKGRNGVILVTGRSNPVLAQTIAKKLGQDAYEPVTIFSDGEIRVKIPPNLRRRHVFIIQPTTPPVNDHLMELVFMIDAARRSSAKEISAVIPYFGYSRQDRKEMPHVPISASVVASIIVNAGAQRIVTVDIHSEQQQGFTAVPWDNLYGSYTLVPEISRRKLHDLVVASPDKGGMTRATGYAKRLNAIGVALVYKERDVALNNKSEALEMIGDVKGKNVLLVDDMIDTAGTIVNAANYLKKRGARKILASATHGIFSGSALARINSSAIEEVIITDTVMHTDMVKKNKKITVVSVAPLLAEAIRRIETGESISRDLIL
ncbi:MAG TPA: ribose-phosphate pyrophosphokinase [Patescibacteria group bacterium]|nr:ribose-phosphate pyrophosphokinase [Patescibacteria group bacterium]